MSAPVREGSGAFGPAHRVAAAALFGLCACAAHPSAVGPLAARNQHPAQLTVLQMLPAAASVLPSGRFGGRIDAAYTSLFLGGDDGTPGTAFGMDGELLRSTLDLRMGLGGGFEAGVDLPVLHTSGGFLDSFLIDYHEFFGFPSQGRETAPRNEFEVAADYRGQRVYELDSAALLLGDVPVTLTYELVPMTRERPGVTLNAGIEFPTGNQDKGAGNGAIDTALGVAATWPLGWASVHVGVQHTFAGSPDRARAADFAFADVTAAHAALEVPLVDDLAGFLQLGWETSTLRDLGFARVANDQLLLWVGGRLRVDRELYAEVAFGEDVAGYVSPDFTAWIGLAWLPGRGDAAAPR